MLVALHNFISVEDSFTYDMVLINVWYLATHELETYFNWWGLFDN